MIITRILTSSEVTLKCCENITFFKDNYYAITTPHTRYGGQKIFKLPPAFYL